MTEAGIRPPALTRLVFVSDVHLPPRGGPELEALVGLLGDLRRRQEAGGPQALFVLGDLFSFWVDRALMTGLFRPALAALAELARSGCPVTVLEGNRDFGLGRVLRESAGVALAGERLVLEHGGQRALLMHGDQLLTRDRRYRLFRRLVRCAPARLVARLAPAPLLLMAIRRLERVSAAEKSRKPPATMELDLEAAGREAAAAGAGFLIHGHTHRPGIVRVPAGGSSATVFCLGDWGPEGAEILEWPPDGEPKLVHWPPSPPAGPRGR